MSRKVLLDLFLLTSSCGRKSQCHSWLVITLAHCMLPGWRHLCSGTLTPLPCQALSHHLPGQFWVSPPFFSSAGRGWFSGGLGRKSSKSATFVLKLSRRPGREEGGGREWVKREMTENSNREKEQRRWRRGEKERLLVGVVEGRLGMWN